MQRCSCSGNQNLVPCPRHGDRTVMLKLCFEATISDFQASGRQRVADQSVGERHGKRIRGTSIGDAKMTMARARRTLQCRLQTRFDDAYHETALNLTCCPGCNRNGVDDSGSNN